MFSAINRSVDFDYLRYGTAEAKNSKFDDIDCITELIVEEIQDNKNFTTENDDDTGNPMNKNRVKMLIHIVWFYEPVQKDIQYIHALAEDEKLPLHLEWQIPICKGYCNIVSPPPDDTFLSFCDKA